MDRDYPIEWVSNPENLDFKNAFDGLVELTIVLEHSMTTFETNCVPQTVRMLSLNLSNFLGKINYGLEETSNSVESLEI